MTSEESWQSCCWTSRRITTNAVVLVLAFLISCTAAGFTSTINAPFAWTYAGSLGQSVWWPIGFTTCDANNNPNQSPVNIPLASVTGPLQTFVIQGVNEPVRTLSAIMHPTTTNVLRADTWPSQLLVYINRNGSTPSNDTRFVFHHMAVHFPAQHTINNVAADGEISFVFFPYNESKSISEYYTDGVNLVMPFTSSPTAAVTRFDKTLLTLTNSLTTGVAKMLLSFPPFGTCAVYEGTLTFPPCTARMTTIVNLNPLELNSATVNALQDIYTRPTARRVQVLGASRHLLNATVNISHMLLVPPTLEVIATQSAPFVVKVTPLDLDTLAYGYGALTMGGICGLLLVAILISFYERTSFVSPFRDTWTNIVAGQSVFGCAQEDDAEDEEDEEDEEDGDEAENDEDGQENS